MDLSASRGALRLHVLRHKVCEQQAGQFVKGQSTEAEVIAKLGPPYKLQSWSRRGSGGRLHVHPGAGAGRQLHSGCRPSRWRCRFDNDSNRFPLRPRREVGRLDFEPNECRCGHRIAQPALSNGDKDETLAIALALCAVFLATPTFARGHSGGGHRAGSSHSGRSRATEFRTSRCKSASCFAKHRDGTWVHPITPRHNRPQ
jgi:hypothetical protein